MHCCCAISVYICLDYWHGSELNDLWEQHKQFIKQEEPQFTTKSPVMDQTVERHLWELSLHYKYATIK